MSALSILPFHPSRAALFDSINRAWIEEMFGVEPVDDVVLRAPQTHIMDQGGDILFVADRGDGSGEEILGTGALKSWGPGIFELTKMGVIEAAQGKKAGETLLKTLITRAQELGATTLFLLTNSACEPALHLYEKNGFVHSAEIAERFGKTYDRCNVAMEYPNLRKQAAQ